MAVFAGDTDKSYTVGSRVLKELAGWDLNPTRVAELTGQAGREMEEQQKQRAEAFQRREANRPLTAAREVSDRAPANLPQVGVVEMDGGRIRTRDEGGSRGVTHPHWREFQAGCVVRLQSKVSAVDPRPEVPRLFLDRPKVHKLVSQLHRQRNGSLEEKGSEESLGKLLATEELAENSADAEASPDRAEISRRDRPQRLMRTCIATLQGADACGRMLAAEAADRGLDQAPRKAFLGDGQTSNWTVWKRYFKRQHYVPIADFIHLISYVYTLAMAVGRDADEGWGLHTKWVTALWSGRAADVLADWRPLAERLGIPPDKALPDDDPRRPIQRGLTYLSNNLQRVDYPRYRRMGLPVTSTLMESLVKEFNLRVKGTEKFWTDPQGAEAILTVRAALLSEDERFAEFFATRPGCRYRRRETLKRENSQAKLATSP